MARVRSKDTRPEYRVRRALWRAGLRYRLHVGKLPGRPDIVFPSRRVVVFVHGCFWHGHSGCPRHRIPKTRVEWWREKILGNMARDKRNADALVALGWNVLTIWECETEDSTALAKLVSAVLKIKSDFGAGKSAGSHERSDWQNDGAGGSLGEKNK